MEMSLKELKMAAFDDRFKQLCDVVISLKKRLSALRAQLCKLRPSEAKARADYSKKVVAEKIARQARQAFNHPHARRRAFEEAKDAKITFLRITYELEQAELALEEAKKASLTAQKERALHEASRGCPFCETPLLQVGKRESAHHLWCEPCEKWVYARIEELGDDVVLIIGHPCVCCDQNVGILREPSLVGGADGSVWYEKPFICGNCRRLKR
jgi:hypothetical protein